MAPTRACARRSSVRPGVQGSQGTRHRTPVPRRRAEVAGEVRVGSGKGGFPCFLSFLQLRNLPATPNLDSGVGSPPKGVRRASLP